MGLVLEGVACIVGQGTSQELCDFPEDQAPCPLGPVTAANTDKVLGSKTRASKGMMCQE